MSSSHIRIHWSHTIKFFSIFFLLFAISIKSVLFNHLSLSFFINWIWIFGTTNDQLKDIDYSVIQLFKIIISLVLIVLLVFLGFFVYNLKKCYLPKRRRERKLRKRGTVVNIQDSSNEGAQIEFAEK